MFIPSFFFPQELRGSLKKNGATFETFFLWKCVLVHFVMHVGKKDIWEFEPWTIARFDFLNLCDKKSKHLSAVPCFAVLLFTCYLAPARFKLRCYASSDYFGWDLVWANCSIETLCVQAALHKPMAVCAATPHYGEFSAIAHLNFQLDAPTQ